MGTEIFPGRYESLAKISAVVSKAAKKAKLDENAVYAVQLAVDEACANIIDHAYQGQDIGEIHITCEITEEGLRVILRDWGIPFDPDSVPKPNFSVPINDLPRRGAGLLLIRESMDEVHYDFTDKRGNTLTLFKRRK